jgi:hypothetical protein
MSYDFSMFTLEPNADLHEAISARAQIKTPTHESKQLSREIANVLTSKNPTLDWQPIAMGNIEGIEIDSGGQGNGIQIHLFSNEAGLTIPYWHKAEEAHDVFMEVWSCLKIIRDITGYVIFDPQLDKVIDLEDGFADSLRAYLTVTDKDDDVDRSYEKAASSLILFRDPNFSLYDAARILHDDSFAVTYEDSGLRVQWTDGPILTIRFARSAEVQQMAAEIGKDTPYAKELAQCDSCLTILFEDLEEVLDEINTLIETQLELQAATRGFLFNNWTEQLSPPEN